jgi:hypothetical protein
VDFAKYYAMKGTWQYGEIFGDEGNMRKIYTIDTN